MRWAAILAALTIGAIATAGIWRIANDHHAATQCRTYHAKLTAALADPQNTTLPNGITPADRNDIQQSQTVYRTYIAAHPTETSDKQASWQRWAQQQEIPQLLARHNC